MKKLFYTLSILFFIASCSNDNTIEIPEETGILVVTKNETYAVTITRDIVYAQGLSHETLNSATTTTMDLMLDVYVPNNTSNNRPAMLLIHGGGFTSGSKEAPQIVNLANYFASRGWVTFSIDYRIQGNLGTVPQNWVTFAENNLDPTMVNVNQFLALYPASRDAKAALRWVFANASNYNINTDYMTVGGGSAGAITATMLGVTDAEDYRDEISTTIDPTLETTNLNQVTKVHSILDFWGSGVTVEVLNDLYGRERFDTNDAPIIIIHGTEDPTVLFEEAEKLRDTYNNTGVAYEFYPLQGVGHGVWDATVNGNRLEKLCFDFLVAQQQLEVQ